MTDKELIERVARVWVDGGGDEEGVSWCYFLIQQAIREEIERRKQDQESA